MIRNKNLGTSLAVQWLRLCTSNSGGTGLIRGQGTKIPYAAQHSQRIKKQNNTPPKKKPKNINTKQLRYLLSNIFIVHYIILYHRHFVPKISSSFTYFSSPFYPQRT